MDTRTAWHGMQMKSARVFFALHQAIGQIHNNQEDADAKRRSDLQRPGFGVSLNIRKLR